MQTLVFVDNGDQPFTCGFQLGGGNIAHAPAGRVRVARFQSFFSPLDGFGYYGDIYLRSFVRKWKRRAAESSRRTCERSMARMFLSGKTNNDVLSEIISFL